MKKLLAGVFCICFFLSSFSQSASNTWSVKISNALRTRYTPTINAMTSKGWEYSNTIMLHGMEKVYYWVNDVNYLNYIKGFIDTYLNADGTFTGAVSLTSLDRVHPGISVLFLYEKFKSTSASDSLKYRTAATALRNVLVGPTASYNPYRTPVKKIFWHKQSGYDNIMLLDGMYMAHPFLAKYGRLFNDNAAIDTAVNQVLFVYNQLYQSGTHLIKHAWKEPGSSGTVSWADGAGNSTSVWSRAMGWYVMSLIDILKYVPSSHPRRGELLTALSNLAVGIKTYQDATTGLWYQIVDKTPATLAGNYLETSGSAMFVYALKIGVDSGWLNSATYLPVAQKGWTGLQTKIDTYTDGMPRINDFAPAMSVQNTEAAYVTSPNLSVDCPVAAGTQHPHGYAAMLMAASAMEFPLVTLPVKFISFTAKTFTDKVTLTWESGDDNEADHYEVQKSVNGNDFTVIGTVKSTGISRYSFDDRSRENKIVYYRIKAVSIDGSGLLSSILPVAPKNNTNQSIQVFPNPADAGNITLLLNGINKGQYNLRIFNSAGIVINERVISINDETSTLINLSLTGVSAGIYHLLMEGNGTRLTKNIVIEKK